jgi:EAL and modified HD-GYP domain-containing signal transduction protein
MDLFIARQPIFDHNLKVYGYEILSRSGAHNAFTATDGDQASINVIGNTFLKIGLHRLTGGKRAFINFTRRLFLDEIGLKLPRELTVIEILEDLEPDPQLIEVCGRLREAGYLLALDDFVARRRHLLQLIKPADIVKVDFLGMPNGEKRDIARAIASCGARLLAEKVETREEFQLALECGYTLFQGFFFSKPEMIHSRDIPGYKLNHLKMLQQLSRRDLLFDALAETIRQDLSLSYKLLNFINSAYFCVRKKVSSVKQAMMLMGEKEIRKWASLVTLTGLGHDKPQELMVTSLARANFCESMASQVGLRGRDSELHMVGLLSLLDVLVGRPLGEVMEAMPLGPEIKAAINSEPNPYRKVLDLILLYEKAEWSRLSMTMAELRLTAEQVSSAYLDSLERAEQILGIQTGSQNQC